MSSEITIGNSVHVFVTVIVFFKTASASFSYQTYLQYNANWSPTVEIRSESSCGVL
jgi:hypothetical protein